MSSPAAVVDPSKGMWWYASDPANLCTLTGLVFGNITLYLILVSQRFNLAMCTLMVSCLCDWLDGAIARELAAKKGRDPLIGKVGGHLDSLCDLVNFGVVPVVCVLTYTQFSLGALVVGACYLCNMAVRLAYFNVFGLKSAPGSLSLSLSHPCSLGLFLSCCFTSSLLFSILLCFFYPLFSSLSLPSVFGFLLFRGTGLIPSHRTFAPFSLSISLFIYFHVPFVCFRHNF
ncbi:CDP-diacylglycerol--serine O-phosphatidyltransferase, variant 3 [Balamuthia mandrillaris]